MTSLTLRPELDLPMIGAGGLMGIRTGVSIMLGAIINYAILAPIMIDRGDIVPNAKGTIGFREITFWSLWCGVAMMTVASLLAFFGKPRIIWAALTKLASAVSGPAARRSDADVLGHIELPLKVSLVGVPVVGALVAVMAHDFFGVEYWLSLVALVLVFVFCLIAINSTGLTSITPIGAMGKLTQLTFGALAPGNKTGESDDGRHHRRSGQPRRQPAAGHQARLHAGGQAAATGGRAHPGHLRRRRALDSRLLSGVLEAAGRASSWRRSSDGSLSRWTRNTPMPAATIWKAVADVLAEGIHKIKPSAQYAALAGILIGIVLEIWRMVTKNRFPLSPVAIGLGFIIPFHTCLSMFVGSLLFWVVEKLFSSKESTDQSGGGAEPGADLRRPDRRRGVDGHRRRRRRPVPARGGMMTATHSETQRMPRAARKGALPLLAPSQPG